MSPHRAAPFLEPGSTIGRYRIEAALGSGGMGAVHRATQLPFGRRVALKVIAPNLVAEAGARERFAREWRAAAAVRHPGILPIYDAGEDAGIPYISMRLVEGRDLRRTIAEEAPLEPGRTARLIAKVGRALDAAHACRLIHRDVKPGNILITGPAADENPYLTDFGLVQAGDSVRGLTESGDWVGTLDYVAPEQIRGDAIDGRADLYALGCVLFEALTGQVPFPRDGEAARLFAHLSDDVPSVGDVLGGSAPAMDAVLATALAKHPAGRVASGAQLGAAAEAAVDASRRTTRSPVRAGAARSRRRLRIAAAGGTATALAVVAIVLTVDDSDDAELPGLPRTAGTPVGKPIPVGGSPLQLAAGHGSVWATTLTNRRLVQIDPAASAVAGEPIRLGVPPDGVVATRDAIWLAGSSSGTVLRVDPRRRRVTARVEVGGLPAYIAAGGGSIWVGNLHGGVWRIDPRTNRVLARISAGKAITGIAVHGDTLFAGDSDQDVLTRVDMRTNRLIGRPQPVGDNPTDVVADARSIWVTARDDDEVVRVDPASGRPTMRVRVPRDPYDLMSAAGSIWVTSWARNTLTRLDARTGRVIGRPIPVGDAPRDIVKAAGALWVANASDGTVTRIQPRE